MLLKKCTTRTTTHLNQLTDELIRIDGFVAQQLEKSLFDLLLFTYKAGDYPTLISSKNDTLIDKTLNLMKGSCLLSLNQLWSHKKVLFYKDLQVDLLKLTISTLVNFSLEDHFRNFKSLTSNYLR